MKKSILVAILIAMVTSACGTQYDPNHESPAEERNEQRTQLFLLWAHGFFWTNYCPADMPTLQPGDHVLTTAAGEDYYFTFPADLNNKTYRITVQESTGQNVVIFYAPCDSFNVKDIAGTDLTGESESLDIITSPRGIRAAVRCFENNCDQSYTLTIPSTPL